MVTDVTELATAPATSPEKIEPVSAQERWIELLLVLFVAFAPPILLSTHVMLFGTWGSLERGNLRYSYICVQQAGALGVLWYVLRRRGNTFANLGLHASRKGTLVGIGLAAAGMLAGSLTLVVIQVVHKHYWGSYLARTNPERLFPKANLAVLVAFVLLNCFYEEAIVRAYLMTEVSQLTGSMGLAIVASVLIQSSYHTYQGWLNVARLATTFLVFSLYYARSRKLFPASLRISRWIH